MYILIDIPDTANKPMIDSLLIGIADSLKIDLCNIKKTISFIPIPVKAKTTVLRNTADNKCIAKMGDVSSIIKFPCQGQKNEHGSV